MRYALFALFIIVGSYGFAQTITKPLDYFDRLTVSRGIEATLFASNEKTLEIQYAGIDLEDIIIQNVNGSLKLKVSSEALWDQIEEDDGWWVRVKIPYRHLEYLEVSTGASVYAKDPLKEEQLDIETSMGGELDVSVEIGSLFLQNSMGGVVDISGTTDELDIVGNMGAVTDASDLEAKVVKAKANMGAELKVNCTEDFSGKASMGGYIRVFGDPGRFRDSSSMGGEISGRNRH